MDKKPLCPYIVSAVSDAMRSLKTLDIGLHVLLWVLLLLFEFLQYGDTNTYIQYMKDTKTEMEQKLSQKGVVDLGVYMYDSGVANTLNRNDPYADKHIASLSTALSAVLKNQNSKLELHTWAIEQLSVASFVTVISSFLVLLFIVTLHYSSAGVLSGGLPAFLIALLTPPLYASIMFTLLNQLLYTFDWAIDYAVRHSVSQSVLTSGLVSAVTGGSAGLDYQIAAERFSDRHVYWIFGVVLKLCVISLVHTNIRVADKPAHMPVSNA